MQLAVNGITKWWYKILGVDLCVELDGTEIIITKNGRITHLPLNDIGQFDIQQGWVCFL